MTNEEIALQEGTQTQLGTDIKMALFRVREGGDGEPPEVVVAVKDDREHKITLHLGDTFPVGDQTWRLDRIASAGGNRLGAVFTRIE